MSHLDELVLDVGSLGRACHFASQCGSADQNVAYADLAAAVRLTVVACEALYDHAGKLDFAVEEDAVVRNEYVVEDYEDLVAAVYLVADVDVVVLLELAGVAGLTADDQGDALSIGRVLRRRSRSPRRPRAWRWSA